MSSKVGFLCGVPAPMCTGSFKSVGRKASEKTHTDQIGAFLCMAKYLTKQGYTRLSRKEFLNPASGYVRVLPKISHFGGRLRMGKEGRLMRSRDQFKNSVVF